MRISACLVTRGDVTLGPIVNGHGQWPDEFEEVLWWDNSERDDLSVFGRYAIIPEARPISTVIYTQDDDVIVPRESIEALIAAYQPGHVVANMPERFRHEGYVDSCLVGFGAIFDRDLPQQAFDLFLDSVEVDEHLFYRTCDVIVSTLTPRILVDVPKTDREFAADPGRMWKQPGHFAERQRMLQLARQVRDRVPA